jgi:Ca2+-binding RTX toxin-like protein
VAANFTLYDADTKQGNITPDWITDRASFVAKFYEQQQRGSGGGGIVPGSINSRYFDVASNTEVLIGAGATNNQRVQYLFGGDNADALEGKGFADHLYGGTGADTLDGKGGNDYLEGGAGDDTLTGGAGNDFLVGGAGTDSYQFDSNFGNDTITDSDGLGSIQIGTITATGGKKVTDNVWQSDDKTLVYTQAGNNLIIGQRTSAGASTVGGTITVKDWHNGQLGITLGDAPATPPVLTRTYLGDQRAPFNSNGNGTYDWTTTRWQADGSLSGGVAEVNFADVIYASAGDDLIAGLGGNDALDGMAGNDVIDGGTGDDCGVPVHQVRITARARGACGRRCH